MFGSLKEPGPDCMKVFKSWLLKCGSNEPNIHIKLIFSQRYCMNEISVIGTFLGSGSFDPNIWVLLPFLDPNIGTLL